MPAETKRVGVQVGGRATGFNRAIMGAQSKLSGFKKMALGMTAAVGAASIAMGAKSVSAAGDFQGAMTESLAIMTDVSDSMRNDMAEAAREVGRTTQFSAEQAAESYFYLASAGLDAAESQMVLGDMAKFAQAGQFDMAKATDIATDANSALGRSVEEVSGVMDVLVAANEQANASVEQFGEAITQKAGGAMRRFNVDMAEGTAVLAQFADTGLKGRRAGTIFARTVGGLARRARENQAIFEKMNISVFNNQGEMRNLTDIIADMETAFKGMSTAEREATLAKMGFNERAMNGLNRLIGNSEALKEYEKNLNNAEGAVDRVASKQMEHFNAQMGLLGDNINDVFIGIGNKLLPSLTDLVQNGMIPFVQNLSKIIDESDSFIGFLDKASEQWLPGMNTEFKRLWNEGGGNFIGMIRQVGREQPGFRGALNTVAGGLEAVVSWFDRIDWQYQKEQALNMAGDIGQEFKGLGQVVSDALGGLAGFKPEVGMDFDWDITTGLGEALRQEFGIGRGRAGATAAGIRSAVFAFITAGTGSIFLGTLAASVGVNLAANPTVKFAKTITDAIKDDKSWEELQKEGVDFGALNIAMKPTVNFITKLKKEVKESGPIQGLLETGVEYPIPVGLGITGITWGIAKAGGAIASMGKGLASIITGMVSLPAALALGTVAASLGIDKVNKTIEEKDITFSEWLENRFETEVPDPWEKQINASWNVVSQMGADQIFSDLADAWEEWKKNPPWQEIDWGETFNPPYWLENWKENPPGWAVAFKNFFSGENLKRVFAIEIKGWNALKKAWNWWNRHTGKAFTDWLEGKEPKTLMGKAEKAVNPRKTGGLLGGQPLIGDKEINRLKEVFKEQNASTQDKITVINNLLNDASEIVRQGKAEKSDLTGSIIKLEEAIKGWSNEMWIPPDLEGEGNQGGTPWTGSGPRGQFAGFVHNQEAVIPSRVLKGGPGPILDFLGYSLGKGKLNADSGQMAGKLDKIEKNTAQVASELNAISSKDGGKITVDINGVVSLEDVLARIAEEWHDGRRAVGRG